MKRRTLTQSSLALAIAAAGLAQSAVAGGFIEDSKANLTLLNYYINPDNRKGTA
ncbi:OprD family porin, partial [Pseudomonas sp. BAgro211]|nr:OprD family porin [Pseudomonas sp. BAgro211]